MARITPSGVMDNQYHMAVGSAGGGITCNAQRGIHETAVMLESRTPMEIGTYNPGGGRTTGIAGDYVFRVVAVVCTSALSVMF